MWQFEYHYDGIRKLDKIKILSIGSNHNFSQEEFLSLEYRINITSLNINNNDIITYNDIYSMINLTTLNIMIQKLQN